MAIKAGRVGVNPSQVDMAGNVISSSDTYTKLEINQMMASKVPVSQLKANSKDFYFAYDSTSEKYGYKAGSDGDFVPFSSASSGEGLVLNNLITTGITFENCSYVSGGYEVIEGVVYLDITARVSASNKNAYIKTLPEPAYDLYGCLYKRSDNDADKLAKFQVDATIPYMNITKSNKQIYWFADDTNRLFRVIAIYPQAS